MRALGGCVRALMFTQAHTSPWSSMYANPYIFVPTRARGLAGCVNMHIFLITVYSNLQAEINRCRNYLGTEINWVLYRRERMISVGFESILEKKKMICCRSIIFSAYRRSIGWTEEMMEKVVPFSAAGCHHAGFTPAYMKKAARTYMFVSVLVRGRGIFNSHFTIFSDSHAARSSHLRYVTCTWHTPPATAIPPLPSSPLRAHPTTRFLHP